MEDFPIRPRRAGAALISLLFAVGGILMSVHTETEFDRAGEYVKTQEHRSGMLLYGSPRPDGRCDFYVVVEGKAVLLDYAEFLPDDSGHVIVEYVVDPENEEHLIAVGSPGDWDDKSRNTYLGTSVLVLCVLAMIIATWSRIVPEDEEALWVKFFPSSRPPGRRARDLTPRRSSQARHAR
jgi:hypothetical protein